METQHARPASERQKQLIQKLSQERNLQLDISLESLDMSTASGIINRLLNPDGDTSRDETRAGSAAPGRRVEHIKLGMAMLGH